MISNLLANFSRAAIVVGACVLAYATTAHGSASGVHGAASLGILAALGAGVLWGTMYIPYRKAYISGMNPLSFVTVFTFGELGTVFALAAAFDGGIGNVFTNLAAARPALFWLLVTAVIAAIFLVLFAPGRRSAVGIDE